MTNNVPSDALGQPLRTRAASPAERQSARELRTMLATFRTEWASEMSNISLASIWPHIERVTIASQDTDPRTRSDAADALLDAVQRAVESTHRRLRECDAWARDHDPE